MQNPVVVLEMELLQEIILETMKAVDCSLQHCLTRVLLVRFGINGQELRRLVSIMCQ
jgi:hypothetical protein